METEPNNGASESIDPSIVQGPSSNPPIPAKKQPTDFIFFKSIGEGSFSTVYEVQEVSSGRLFAIKQCRKAQLRKERKTEYVVREKDAMKRLNVNAHPFTVQLYATFQDNDFLYFCMTLCECGELLEWIRKKQKFSIQVTSFYAAEMIIALEHLNKIGIIHRDLKPENILLTTDMHIKLSDFGSAKLLEYDRPTPLLPTTPSSKKGSFVGTAHYSSPELLQNGLHTYCMDLWALGCVTYQMTDGKPPFVGATDYLIFQKIIAVDYNFDDSFEPVVRDLVEHLIVTDCTKRLGSPETGGFNALKAHRLFEKIDWELLPSLTPPLSKPTTTGLGASRNDSGADLQPGLDERRMAEMSLSEDFGPESDTTAILDSSSPSDLADLLGKMSELDRERRLTNQETSNVYHQFTEGNLILKSGMIEKKKGLLSKHRMFLLTEGPNLYYVDPVNMVLKGKIPWSKEMTTAIDSFKNFYINTPGRVYHLVDNQRTCMAWCDAINKVRRFYFGANSNELDCVDSATVGSASKSPSRKTSTRLGIWVK